MSTSISIPRTLVVLTVLAAGSVPGALAQEAGRAEVNGVGLYYEIHGSGSPLVLVGGLGTATWLWERQMADFAEHFTTVVFDNRGIGRSDAPEGPYSVAMMADDLAGLLDHLSIDRAHVLGVSLGGFIAQEFALRYPERVERLVLAVTSAGGGEHVAMSPETMAQFMATTEDPRELIRMRLPLVFTDAFLSDEATVEHLIAQRLERPQPPHGFTGQLLAGSTFDAAGRVHAIQAPTLVVSASEDRIVPVANARRLAAALPNAELRVYEGYGHQFFVEIPERFNRDVIAFLQPARRSGD